MDRVSCFMVNWVGRAAVGEQTLVLQRVAVQMLAGIFETPRVSFTHNLCEGVVEQKGSGVYANMGGIFFHAALNDYSGEPYEADFFIPRHKARVRLQDAVVSGQLFNQDGTPSGYAIDPDLDAVLGGNLRIHALGA